MVMLSDSESKANEAASAGVDEVCEDSLQTFPSEGTAADSVPLDVADRSATTQPPKPISQVSVAIIDDLATREAMRKLGEYHLLAKLDALGASIETRFVGTDDSVHALREGLEKQLAQTDEIVKRTEGLVTDRALQDLTARIEARLAEVTQAFQRIERAVASESLARQAAIETLRSHIGERLEQTEEIVRRSEDLIADRAVRGVSACIDARVTGADEVVRRIEQVVTNRSREQAPPPQALHAEVEQRSSEPSPRFELSGVQRVVKSLAAGGALVAVAILVLVMRVPIAGEPRPVSDEADREAIARDASVDVPVSPDPLPTPAPTPTPPSTVSQRPAVSRPAARPARQTPPRRATVPVPPDDDVAPAPRGFVGDLSISSTPSGARVFINGRAVGVTPLVLNERPAGSVAVQVSSAGFERWSASVQVRAGQMTTVAATLQRADP